MDIRELKRHWNRFGEADPLWAIVTQPDKKGNRWQADDFFRTGEEEVAMIIDYLLSMGIHLRRSRALDFGCGVGRLTQALANYFTEVCGVDIAPSMIRLAERYNRRRNCKYHLNDRADLRLFDDASFDFIYTSITLQHMEPAYIHAYLKEFLRLLVPGGILVFNLPSERISPLLAQGEGTVASNGQHETTEADDKSLLAKIKRFIKSLIPGSVLDFYLRLRCPKPPIMEMHAIRREEMERFLKLNGAQMLDIVERQIAGPEWIGYRYCVAKGHAAT